MKTLTLPEPVSAQEFEQLFRRLSNWGRWGEDDERGTLNYITPEHIKTAAGLVPPDAASPYRCRSTRSQAPTTRGRRSIT